MKIKNILRTVFAFIFAAGGISHIVLITTAPQAYEGFSVSFLLLGKGKKPKIGLILAALFCLVLVPFWWNGGAIINIILLFVILWLLRFKYPDPG
jgi:hypothetical protein